MCANVQTIPDREDLLHKLLQLEDENKHLWDEIKTKNEQILLLNDKLALQGDFVKSRDDLQKLLNEYLQTIRQLQRDLMYLQNENKILEQKFYNTHVSFKQLCANGGPDQKKVGRENAALRMKIHALEKELRRYVHFCNKTANVSADIVVARDRIANLEYKLYQCQSVVVDYKQAKTRLVEAEEKLKSSNFMNVVLKEELEKTKNSLREITGKHDELKTQLGKYVQLVAKLRKENTSMEGFIEKSFRLEGALAELDDLNVVLKKQETMLGVLFDENQSLKDGISRLFEDMNMLKDRNWKLEKYATEIENSFYAAEKNVDTLEHKLDYYETLEIENEKLGRSAVDMRQHIKYLEDETGALLARLENLEKQLDASTRAVSSLKNDNQKLRNENSTLRISLTNKNVELYEDNEHLKVELDKFNARMHDFAILQEKYGELQNIVRNLRSELRTVSEENETLRKEVDRLQCLADALKVDRERYKDELNHIRLKYKQLEYDSNQPPIGYGDYRNR